MTELVGTWRYGAIRLNPPKKHGERPELVLDLEQHTTPASATATLQFFANLRGELALRFGSTEAKATWTGFGYVGKTVRLERTGDTAVVKLSVSSGFDAVLTKSLLAFIAGLYKHSVAEFSAKLEPVQRDLEFPEDAQRELRASGNLPD